MSTALATLDRRDMAATMEDVVAKGDLSRLTAAERAQLYVRVCESLGLNPMGQPFDYIELDGKLTLYPNAKAANQLGALNNVSVAVVDRKVIEGIYLVTARATTPDGRSNEAVGAVPIVKENGQWKTANSGKRYFEPDGTVTPLSPLDKANAMMKAETKAQRRVILQLISLGWARESPPAPTGDATRRPSVGLVPSPPAALDDGRMSAGQRAAIMARIRELKIDAESRRKMLVEHYGKDSLADDAPNPLTREEAEHFRVYLDVISGAAAEDDGDVDDVGDLGKTNWAEGEPPVYLPDDQDAAAAGPASTEDPFTHWGQFWPWIKQRGLPGRKPDLEEWLGESVTHLTPQQVKELVELKLSERAELAQAG